MAVALLVWGTILPIVYDSFGVQFQQFFDSGVIPSQFAQFGGGDIFSLAGAVALGFVHPIAVGLNLVFALGFGAAAVAGERQRGTLEVLLSRPHLAAWHLPDARGRGGRVHRRDDRSRSVAGSFIGSAATGRTAELGVGNLPILWLNGVLLFWAFGAIALLASVSSDRLTPAIGVSLAFVLVSYFLDVLGSLWPDAKWLQPYSLFYYVDAKADLAGLPHASDFVVLAAVIAVAVGAALVVFPRRDLAAPA